MTPAILTLTADGSIRMERHINGSRQVSIAHTLTDIRRFLQGGAPSLPLCRADVDNYFSPRHLPAARTTYKQRKPAGTRYTSLDL